MFNKVYWSALKGNALCKQIVLRLVAETLRAGRKPHDKLLRYFLDEVQGLLELNLKRTIEAQKKKKRSRGRPSVDEELKRLDLGFTRQLRHLTPTQEYALMVFHLQREGHPVKIDSNAGKKSAVNLVSEITTRSSNQLESDYYRHRQMFIGNEDAYLDRARVLLVKHKCLHEIRSKPENRIRRQELRSRRR